VTFSLSRQNYAKRDYFEDRETLSLRDM